jgi:SNF2 family DNA or RNA helicase
LTFNELELNLNLYSDYLNQYQIIGIDEIHNLYRMMKSNMFDIIVSSTIKHRWGITGTPFVSNLSLFNIIKFLTGCCFKNERIANSPSVQSQFIDLFLKNCKIDMIDDYIWPELNIHNVFVKLDIVQQNLYNAEVMLNKSTLNLRKLVCEINLMFDGNGTNGDFKTPSELKQYGIIHYQKLYETELTKLEELNKQLKNIKEHESDFTQLEYIQRVKHFMYLIEKQSYETEKHRKVSEYFLNSIDEINKIITHKLKKNDEEQEKEEKKEDEDASEYCKICWSDYSSPITYLKSCGHYFCKNCIDTWKNTQDNLKCPMCRKDIIIEDIINIQEICDINNSSKIHELLNIINGGDKYIIFTQFNKVIERIQSVLTRNNIASSTLDKYTDENVLLLSSQQNAEGINLSMFDKMIIFEPFENNVYNNQVEQQLIARIHRVGRVKPVDVYRFITIGTIEEKIYSEFS